jgi:putative SOS response-associated peptidase YedK
MVPAAGFYEWRNDGGKQPYYFSRKDGQPLMLAGIWEESEYKGDRRVLSALLTDELNDLGAPYHDRMPLALADEATGFGGDRPGGALGPRCLALGSGCLSPLTI